MISGRGPANPVTAEDDQLLTYPYVVVRMACGVCKKTKRYRLARLVETFGPDIPMPLLLARLTINCAWKRDRDYKGRLKGRDPNDPPCGAYFVDLVDPRPAPDLPPEKPLSASPQAPVYDHRTSPREIERLKRVLRS